jgi:hypothetical protein
MAGRAGEGCGMSKVFEIHTSCGNVFRQTLNEMSDRQLSGLIDQNPDSPDINLLRAELISRQERRAAA